MRHRSIGRPILEATLICGTLDISFALALSLLRARSGAALLRFVASGPFPGAVNWGVGGALLGLVLHYGLMAIMVAAFVILAKAIRRIVEMPAQAGLAYGLVTYAVMNLVIVPLRFPTAWPPKPVAIGTQLFAHIVLVGLPTAFIARKYLRR